MSMTNSIDFASPTPYQLMIHSCGSFFYLPKILTHFNPNNHPHLGTSVNLDLYKDTRIRTNLLSLCRHASHRFVTSNQNRQQSSYAHYEHRLSKPPVCTRSNGARIPHTSTNHIQPQQQCRSYQHMSKYLTTDTQKKMGAGENPNLC